jgi:KDO2-lipid IV(A) lauroyltransferase
MAQLPSSLRIRLEALAVVLMRGITGLLPLRWVSAPGAAMGWALFHVFRLARRATLRNLEIAFGDRTQGERRRIAVQCYCFFGAVLWEFLNLGRIPRQRLGEFIALTEREVLDQALAQGRGVVLVSGHLGHWELMAGALAAAGYPVSMYVGGQSNALVDGLMNAVRRSLGPQTIGRGNLRALLKALKERHVVALLADQHEHTKRWYVRFFGQPVSAVSGPAQMLRRSGAALVFGACLRAGTFRYRTRFRLLPLPEAAANEEQDILNVTQVIFDALEAVVREHPEQYFWMHRRFRPIPKTARFTESNRRWLAEHGVAVPPEAAQRGEERPAG